MWEPVRVDVDVTAGDFLTFIDPFGVWDLVYDPEAPLDPPTETAVVLTSVLASVKRARKGTGTSTAIIADLSPTFVDNIITIPKSRIPLVAGLWWWDIQASWSVEGEADTEMTLVTGQFHILPQVSIPVGP